MEIALEKLKELLVTPGHVAEADFNIAAAEAEKKRMSIQDVLLDKDFIKDNQLAQLIADEVGVPFVNIKEEKIDEVLLNQIPELVARAREVIVFGHGTHGIRVGMTNPEDIETRHLIEKRLGDPIEVVYITKLGLQDAVSHYKGSLKTEFDKVLHLLGDETLPREERDEAIVRMVDMLLSYGYESKASDIHIEPHTDRVLVRFRIDGVMHDMLDMPKELLELLLTRIKILAKLRTDEHRAAQDGKLTFSILDERVDVRVSILPVTEGENIVLRLLSAKSRQFGLSDLGMRDVDLERIERAIQNPHGMVLVTGPTGSGKTTTVYGMLKIINTRDVHIATIEDPVEYEIEGISQIQVNPRTNLTFAKGLRAIVRQDPDIIMVGEIRDEETADIAVNSAMTGHLVLSTLHANDAATTLPRLLDMHVEPFLVASTVNIVIAQRLVRRICAHCRTSYVLSTEEKKMIEGMEQVRAILMGGKKKRGRGTVRLYRGVGCKVCSMTGYLGRVGIFEVLEVDEEIKRLITERASSVGIITVAREHGMTTMLEDGIAKVVTGITTLEEVIRATTE